MMDLFLFIREQLRTVSQEDQSMAESPLPSLSQTSHYLTQVITDPLLFYQMAMSFVLITTILIYVEIRL